MGKYLTIIFLVIIMAGTGSNVQSGKGDVDKRNADKLTESLKEQQKRFDLAEKIAHLGSLEWYVKTGNMIWSDELYRILGFEPGSFKPTYQKFIKNVHPADSKRVLESIQNIFNTDKPFDIEFRIIRPDETIRYTHMVGEVYRNDQKRPLKMNGSVQDITERREMEERLKEQYDKLLGLTAVLDGMDDPVIITDHSGVISYVNRACEKILGYASEKILTRHISDCKDSASSLILKKEVFIDDPKSVWTGNLTLRNKFGLPIQTSLKSTPIIRDNHIISRAFVLRVQY